MKKVVKKFKSEVKEIPRIQDFIVATLAKYKVRKNDIAQTLLSSEDIIYELVGNKKSKKDEVWVNIKKGLFDIKIQLSCPGTLINIGEVLSEYKHKDPELNDAINRLMNKVFTNNIISINSHGINKIIIPINTFHMSSLYYILFALIMGIPCGLLLKNYIPVNVSKIITENVFSLFNNAFLQFLKFVLGPIIFFSLAASISSISDISKLGKIAIKVAVGYVCTSILALLNGLIISKFFFFKNENLAKFIYNNASSNASNVKMISFKDNILNIIPTDIISPFLNLNMLQLIFFSIIIGVAVATSKNGKETISNAMNTINNIFMRIIEKAVVLIPIYVFFGISLCVYSINLENLSSLIRFFLALIISLFIMLIIYMLLLIFIGKIHPIKFLQKIYPAMTTSFSLSSSNATIPTTLKCCEEIGISKSVYSFSIPFGATINMDGTVITCTICSMLFMHLLGINLTMSQFIAFCATIILISVGLPGIPNASVVGFTLVFNVVGIPLSAITFVVAIASIVEMFSTMVNVTGDITMTTIVASSENLISKEKLEK